MHRILGRADLRPTTDPSTLPFATTESVPDLDDSIGQDRATRALTFGIGMRRTGYNIYAMGEPDTDKRSVVERLVGNEAAVQAAPADWCYVQRFGDTNAPRALRLVAGKGRELQRAMRQFAEDLRAALPRVFQQEEFRSRSQEISHDYESRQRDDFAAMQKEAEAEGLTMLQTPNGFAFAPVRDGKVLDNDGFQALHDEERTKVTHTIEALMQRLMERMQAVPSRQQTHARAQRELARAVTATAVAAMLEPLRARFQNFPEVLGYLSEVAADVVEHTPTVIAMDSENPGPPAPGTPPPERFFARYAVNLLVDHTDAGGAAVIYESNPTVENLIGRIEHRAEMGMLVTDFTMIRPGALHRANGGYLLVDIERLLVKPLAWDALKRALFDRQLRIESIAQLMAIGPGSTLEPDPIPLNLKVIVLGTAYFYYMLSAMDPDFGQLFKVAADFAERVPRDNNNVQRYASLIATLARQARLRALDRDAVAAVIDHAVRLAGDRDKISALTHRLADLLREADHYADRAGAPTIASAHVHTAIEFQIDRLDRMRNEVHDRILEKTVLIDVSGRAVGQVNGLTVMQAGVMSFGQPARITATARLGRGEIIDIEREAKLGGNLHSKAVMIVTSFIGNRFGQLHPLSFNASLVFEQSYGGIEGDSASVAEVCALLSAIGGISLRQDFAITGSMNQHGRVQAIGGANEKTEGFFHICSSRGLSGTQGVILPTDNVRHLMLREDVVAAVERGEFHIYAIETIDDAIELLTDLPAGELGSDDQYPADSFNGRVARRLEELWQRARRAGHKDDANDSGLRKS